MEGRGIGVLTGESPRSSNVPNVPRLSKRRRGGGRSAEEEMVGEKWGANMKRGQKLSSLNYEGEEIGKKI